MLSSARLNTDDTAEKVKMAQVRLEGMAKDLLELAKTNDNAKKIVEEFNIQLIKPAANAPAAQKRTSTLPTTPPSPSAKR